MRRDPTSLTAQTFDVLVVGGGIYGLTIARDAAQRGLSVALIDRDDFGSGSSFNHLRTIHGGLRYLQTLDIARSRESVLERRTLARIAPHAVQLLRFVLPLYRSILKGRLAMRAGFLLDRLVASDRNRGILSSHTLPAGQVISRSEVADRFPGLRRKEVTGAGAWYDYVTTEADRLTLSWGIAAAADGAVLANYIEAEAPLTDGRRVVGIKGVDRTTRQSLEIGARMVVNATGACLDGLLAPLGLSSRPSAVVRAMNLVTSRDAGVEALGGISPSGRNYFLVPWRGKALFGTWESGHAIQPNDFSVPERDVEQFIQELNLAFPALDLNRTDITLVHRGNVPALSATGGSLTMQSREQVRDHASEGIDGLVSVAGTKYTTARAVAERITDLIVAKLRRDAVPCRTATTPLPGGDIGDVGVAIARARRDDDAALPSDTLPHLIAAYGSGFDDIARLARQRRDWQAPVSATSPVIGAQIVWAMRHEMALTLSDAVIRRTPLGALGYPGDDAAGRAAALMAEELGWSADRVRDERRELRAFYGLS